jgi:hypothetical protein
MNFLNFLNSFRCTENPTHLSYGKFNGKFSIPSDKYDDFMKLYYKEIKGGNQELSILECQKDYSKILIDIDIKVDKNNWDGKRLYSNKLIKKIGNYYIDSICRFLSVDSNDLKSYLFEKSEPTIKDDEVKDGFHLVFPNIVTTKQIREMIYNEVVERCNEDLIFGIENKANEIIDKAVVSKNSWFLFGSTKPNNKPYEITCIFGDNMKVLEEKVTLKDVIKSCSLYNCSESNKTNMRDDIDIDIEENEPPKGPEIKEDITPAKSDDSKEKISDLLKNLNDKRADDYESWLSVLFFLKNASVKDEYLDLFHEFSRRSNKYDFHNINKKWKECKKRDGNKIGIGTMIKYLMEDNHEAYKEWSKKWNMKLNNKSYESIKEEFEKTHFKIMNPIMFATIDRNGALILRNKTDFKTAYENIKFDKSLEDGKIVDSEFTVKWMQDENIRTYEKLDFLPKQECPDYIYNTFSGFEAEQKELFDVNIHESHIMKHIKNLCGNDDKVFNWFINWLSRLFKNPGKLSNTAPIFKSIEGTGKDLFFNWIGNKIMGSEYYLNTEKTDLIFGRFTSSIENKILIIINETSGKATFQINENIKAAITAEYNQIEHKGLKPYQNKNNIGYGFLTNNDNPVKVSPTDRRFCGIECNNQFANNAEYMKELINEMNSGKYDRAFYNYLLSIESNDYDFTNNRPITSFYEEMKEMNLPVIAKFLEDLCYEYTNIVESEFTSGNMYNKFNDYIKQNNFKIEMTSTKFGIEIKRYSSIIAGRTSDKRFYKINFANLKEELKKKYNIEFTTNETPIIELEKKSPLDD